MPAKKSRGQAAIEYLIIFGIALTLSLPFITRAQQSMLDLRSGSEVIEARNSMEKLESAAETVNAAGPPSQRTFSFELPDSVRKAYLLNKSVIYNLRTRNGELNVSRTFDFNVSGSLPEEPGNYQMNVRARQDSVELGVR